MKVRIEKEQCSGDELCVDVCPELFEMQEEVAVVKMEDVPEELQGKCREAVEACPTEAIIIEE